MEVVKLLASRERAAQLREYGLKITEPKDGIFIALKSDVEQFRKDYAFVRIELEDVDLADVTKSNQDRENVKLLIDQQRADEFREYGLKIDELEEGIFIASKKDVEEFRAAWVSVYIPTESLPLLEVEAQTDTTEETRADGSSAIAPDMSTRELLDIFGLNGDEIQILQKRYADFPITGSNGVYTARFDELKRWHRANPDVLRWSDIHFKYDGKAV